MLTLGKIYIEELGWVVMDIAPETMLDQVGDPPDLKRCLML